MAKVKERVWTTKGGETRTAWIADYRDQQGVRRLKTFERKKDADAWLDQAKVEVRQGIHTAASASKTVTEAWEMWLQHGEAEKLERSTTVQRRIHLHNHVAPFIGTVKLSALTAPMIHSFDSALRGGHAPQDTGQHQDDAAVRTGARSRSAKRSAGGSHQGRCERITRAAA